MQEIDGTKSAEYSTNSMEAIAEALEAKLHQWQPEISRKARALVAEIIELADDGVLDLVCARTVEQGVLDILAAPASR